MQTTMAKQNLGRLAATIISVAVFAISLVFNVLSVFGVGEINLILLSFISLQLKHLNSHHMTINTSIICKFILDSVQQLDVSLSIAGPYTTTTSNVSALFDTELTPSGWTFNIWAIIYIWLSAMIVYIVSGLCRR